MVFQPLKYLVRYSKDYEGKYMTIIFDDDAYSNIFFICSCAKFETEGILCKHILKIMPYTC